MKILLVALVIGLFWITIFLISLKYQTDIKIITNISEPECFKMNCSYQPKTFNRSICICPVE